MAKKVFTQRVLKNLDIFEYKSVCHSILSRLVLDPIYSMVIYAVPKSISPNQMTVFNGVFYTLFTMVFALSFYSDEHPLLSKAFKQPIFGNLNLNDVFDKYGFYMNAIMLVLYQAIDSLDGKQARRTNSSSPVGHLLDHGIDGLVTGLVCINLYFLIGLDENQFYAYLICCLTVFYMNAWEEFHTKVLYFGVLSGAIEGLFAMAGLLILFPSKEHWHFKLIQNTTIISYVELVCQYVVRILFSLSTYFGVVLVNVSKATQLALFDLPLKFVNDLIETLGIAYTYFETRSIDKMKNIPLEDLFNFIAGKNGLFNFKQGMTLIQLLVIISIVFTAISSVACILNVLKKKKLSGLFKLHQFIPFFGFNSAILYYMITSDHVASPKQFALLIFGWVFSFAYSTTTIICARVLNQSFPLFPKSYLGYIVLIILKFIHNDIIK
eukprot:NODE_6_length_70510_cov_1.054395.p18 type:complete len:437 gc:universal NODE_6_length_70510_cov_1.054395:43675-42365(-)